VLPVSTTRLPTYAISHGGGPWPWIKDSFMGDWGPLERALEAIPVEIGVTPSAVLCVTAHWIAADPTVQLSPQPTMLYDYSGFPPSTYEVQYPAPGSPEVAERVAQLLEGAGIPAGRDERRGFDHGTFVPLAVMYPEADVPVVQLSIRRDFDPAAHLALGRALAPLRDENVLIVGSGLPSYHNLSMMGPGGTKPSRAFDAWLTDAVVGHEGEERNRLLGDWERAPDARVAHPMPDHLLPVMVAVGAAEHEPGAVQYHEDAFLGSMASSNFRIGSW
jgi:aromatic ring-opening dioxygenase catalytic subunit (LigB family)